jgi:hypothetical protein
MILKQTVQGFDPDEGIHFNATRTLFDIGEQGPAIESLLRTAHAKNIDVFTRVDALETLFVLGEETTAIELMLVFIFDSGIDVDGKSSTLEVLGRLAGNSPRVIKEFLKLSQDTTVDELLRRDAAGLLMSLDHETQAIETLLALALDPNVSTMVRQSAIRRVSKSKSVPILDSLKKISNDPNDLIKISVAQAFVELGENQLARPTFLDFIKEPNPLDIRLNASIGLVRLGDTLIAIDVLLKIMRTKGVGTSTLMTGIRELIDLGKKSQAEEILLEIARDPSCDEHLLVSICHRLHLLGQHLNATNLALQIIGNSKVGEGAVRRTVRLLNNIGDTSPATIECLLQLVQQPSITQSLRTEVTQTLSRLSLESQPIPKLSVV